MARSPICFVYYCSGHGYGHATRVSAFARHLLNLDDGEGMPVIYIVSSAPEHVFADSIICGAKYRFAEIDPVIVQPLAYRVDRRKSVEVLKKFLDKKDELLERERQWLLEVRAHCVLSDAAFLGCLAARAAGLPSILITNFSFDSVYSYLSTPLLDATPSPILGDCSQQLSHMDSLSAHGPGVFDAIADDPIPHAELAPLVAQIHAGYRCAQLLIRLPGHIPMPSFFASPPLPSFEWVDVVTRRLKPDILVNLTAAIREQVLLPGLSLDKIIPRAVWQGPLIVRPPRPAVYTPEGRARFLDSIGIPAELHNAKILIVSFGGQVFKRPGSSRGSSRASSRHASHEDLSKIVNEECARGNARCDIIARSPSPLVQPVDLNAAITQFADFEMHIRRPTLGLGGAHPSPPLLGDRAIPPGPTGRLATPNHIYIPGAPPAAKPLPSPALEPPVAISMIPPTPPVTGAQSFAFEDDEPRLLPDDGWIAVVCGVSKEQWASGSNASGDEDELPENFFVAPRDVYMPDLTAVGDVLLGKLGYGTVSECVDACTPFVYVSRPLFVEEHGLRVLLEQDGVGVELSRDAYEGGEWAGAVREAYLHGYQAKERKRRDMAAGVGVDRREAECTDLAREVVKWVGEWWG